MGWAPASLTERTDASRIYAVAFVGSTSAIFAGRVKLEEMGTVILNGAIHGSVPQFQFSTSIWVPDGAFLGSTVQTVMREILSRIGVPNTVAMYSAPVGSLERSAYLAVVQANRGPFDEGMGPLGLAIELGYAVTMAPFVALLAQGLQVAYQGAQYVYEVSERAIQTAGAGAEALLRMPIDLANRAYTRIRNMILIGAGVSAAAIVLYASGSGKTVGRVLTDLAKGFVDGGEYAAKSAARVGKAFK
jgi:hypothetical protein